MLESSERPITPRLSSRRLPRAASIAIALLAVVGMGQLTGCAGGQKPAPITPTTTTVRDAVESGMVTWNGKPAQGATVAVSIVANSDVESKLADGQTLPTIPIPPVTTGADGRYHVALDPASVPAMFREGANEIVNFQIDVSYRGQQGEWNSTAQACEPPSAGGDWCVDGESIHPQLSFDLGSRPTVLDNVTDETRQPLTLLP